MPLKSLPEHSMHSGASEKFLKAILRGCIYRYNYLPQYSFPPQMYNFTISKTLNASEAKYHYFWSLFSKESHRYNSNIDWHIVKFYFDWIQSHGNWKCVFDDCWGKTFWIYMLPKLISKKYTISEQYKRNSYSQRQSI